MAWYGAMLKLNGSELVRAPHAYMPWLECEAASTAM
jgi:hypothetical protein